VPANKLPRTGWQQRRTVWPWLPRGRETVTAQQVRDDLQVLMQAINLTKTPSPEGACVRIGAHLYR
jgi:hypothetical protein